MNERCTGCNGKARMLLFIHHPRTMSTKTAAACGPCGKSVERILQATAIDFDEATLQGKVFRRFEFKKGNLAGTPAGATIGRTS